jgi:hypothetical protein
MAVNVNRASSIRLVYGDPGVESGGAVDGPAGAHVPELTTAAST